MNLGAPVKMNSKVGPTNYKALEELGSEWLVKKLPEELSFRKENKVALEAFQSRRGTKAVTILLLSVAHVFASV